MRKLILITGANKGLGLALVEQILAGHPDVHVLLGARDAGRGTGARAALPSDAQARVTVLQLSVEVAASAVAAAAWVAGNFPGEALYGLVNNAGIASGDVTSVCAVNVHGIKHVCDAFIPLLHPTEGRIVNITSAAGPMYVAKCGPSRVAELTDYNVTWPQIEALVHTCAAEALATGSDDAYYVSKALANSLTMCLARENPGLTIHSCTPGFLETDMTRPMAAKAGKTASEMGMKSVAEGTVAPLFLLFSDHVEELPRRGFFFGSDAKRSPLFEYRAPGSAPYDGP